MIENPHMDYAVDLANAFADMVDRTGYPMAKNLRAKIPEGDTLLLHDRDTAATTKFVEEMITISAGRKLRVEVLTSPREVAERSVSSPLSFGHSFLSFIK